MAVLFQPESNCRYSGRDLDPFDPCAEIVREVYRHDRGTLNELVGIYIPEMKKAVEELNPPPETGITELSRDLRRSASHFSVIILKNWQKSFGLPNVENFKNFTLRSVAIGFDVFLLI